MGVTESRKVDAMAVGEDGALIMLITDPLTWRREEDHLNILIDKINAYCDYWEDREYEQLYPGQTIRYVIFEIHFRYEPTANAMRVLESIQRQLTPLNVQIHCHIGEEE